MNNNTSQNQAPSQEGEKKRRKIVVILLFLAFVTSIITGFMIGRSTGTYDGQIIDTIVIGSDQKRKLHISGQVLYTDGTPYQNGKVELHSDPMITTTDMKGRFFYDSVAPGQHKLSIVDDNKTLAECSFVVNRNTSDQPINIGKEGKGKYAIEVSVDVRFIELAVEIAEDGQELKLIPEHTVVLKDDGTLLYDEHSLNVKDGAVVLPSGTVVLPDKTVIVPDYLILPDNDVQPIPEEGYAGGNGEHVDKDGKVELPDGTIISSDGVEKPDGTVIAPDEPYQIVPEENTNHVDQPNGEQPVEPSIPIPVQPTEPTNDNGEFHVKEQGTSGWVPWESISTIDLFKNRFGTSQKGNIQPGSYGYYVFRLENTRKRNLQITLQLSDDDLHLPLEFTLTPLDQQGNKIQTKAVTGSLINGSLTLEHILNAETRTTYQLDWNWPKEGNDALDTKAGMQAGTYLLKLQVRASEYM